MQESKDVLNYEKMHSIDKRRAAIDSRYRAFVTNKAFTDYFEYEHFYTITDFVHPDEVGRLKKFIDEFAGDTQEQVFRFRFKDGSTVTISYGCFAKRQEWTAWIILTLR